MKKILLVTANNKPQGQPSLGPAYIASYLTQYLDNIEIKILEYIPNDLSVVYDFSPDLIGLAQ